MWAKKHDSCIRLISARPQLDEKDLEDSLLDDASSEEEVIDAKRPTSLTKGEPRTQFAFLLGVHSLIPSTAAGSERPKTKSGARSSKVVSAEDCLEIT
jgi:hypothetical protein